MVRHYLQDVGSTFGTGAHGPREYDEGWEAPVERRSGLKRLVRSASTCDRGRRPV